MTGAGVTAPVDRSLTESVRALLWGAVGAYRDRPDTVRLLRRHLEPNGWTAVRVVTSDFHVPRTTWVFQKVLGPAYDVAFSPASSELDAAIIAARARW